MYSAGMVPGGGECEGEDPSVGENERWPGIVRYALPGVQYQ